LLLRIFKEYFQETERKWLSVFERANTVLKSFRQDREMLMSKFTEDLDIESILSCKDDSMENLAAHKRAILFLLGKKNDEEDRRLKAEQELQ